MMSSSSKNPDSKGPQLTRRGKKGRMQNLMFIIAAVVVVVIVVAVIAVPKKTGSRAPRQLRDKSTRTSSVRQQSRSGGSVAASRRDRGRGRDRRKDRSRGTRGRGRDRDRGTPAGYVSGGGSSRSGRSSRGSGVPVLTTIVTNPEGSRVAVFGTRSVRAGDEIDGRKVLEVEANKVRVEYKTSAYEVKVGDPLYKP